MPAGALAACILQQLPASMFRKGGSAGWALGVQLKVVRYDPTADLVPAACCPCSQHRVCCNQTARVESPRASVADWIHHMLKCEFFSTCPRHRDHKKAEVRAIE